MADVSPVNREISLDESLFDVLKEVKFPSNVTLAQARSEIDKQMAERVQNSGIRAFLLTNLTQNEDGSYGWRLNVPVLADHFANHIARFPEVGGATFEGPTLFVAGGQSDYLR